MPDLFSFVEQYGDQTFADKPLTDVDAVIIAQLAYLNFPQFAGHYAINTLTEFQLDRLTDQVWEPTKSLKLLQLMAQSRRYRELRCVQTVSLDGLNGHCTAMDFDLDGRFHYVAFRGTQSDFRDWREDFTMAFKKVIPAQKSALRFLERAMKQNTGTYYVGGHSKGGSLAVYAFSHLTRALSARVRHCFSLDAPDRLPHGRIRSRITKLVPQSTFIGILLDPTADFQVIAAHAVWMDQHNPFTWTTAGDSFLRRARIDGWAHYWQHTLAGWVRSLDREHIELFVDGLFGALSRTGTNNFEQFGSKWQSNLRRLIRELGRGQSRTRTAMRETTRRLLLSGLSAVPALIAPPTGQQASTGTHNW